MAYLTDSHAHLDLCGNPAIELSEALDHGVAHVISVGFDLASSRRAAEIARRHPRVSAAAGIHPHDADQVDNKAIGDLRKLASRPEVVAIGETGLDYYRNRSPHESQQQAFLKQIELAHETGLTLIVHSREASEDVLGILQKHARGLRVVLHCFSLYEHLDECARNGYYMSVAGNVTFPKAAELRQAAREIPAHLLLSETDLPWLTPVPYRGQPNRPANIRFVLEELALLRRMEPGDLAKQIFANFQAAFPAATALPGAF